MRSKGHSWPPSHYRNPEGLGALEYATIGYIGPPVITGRLSKIIFQKRPSPCKTMQVLDRTQVLILLKRNLGGLRNQKLGHWEVTRTRVLETPF